MDVPLTPIVVDVVTFDRAPLGRRGYNEDQVDDFLDRVQATLAGEDTLTARDVREVEFDAAPFIRRGYHEDQVDEFLDLVVEELDRREGNVLAPSNGAAHPGGTPVPLPAHGYAGAPANAAPNTGAPSLSDASPTSGGLPTPRGRGGVPTDDLPAGSGSGSGPHAFPTGSPLGSGAAATPGSQPGCVVSSPTGINATPVSNIPDPTTGATPGSNADPTNNASGSGSQSGVSGTNPTPASTAHGPTTSTPGSYPDPALSPTTSGTPATPADNTPGSGDRPGLSTSGAPGTNASPASSVPGPTTSSTPGSGSQPALSPTGRTSAASSAPTTCDTSGTHNTPGSSSHPALSSAGSNADPSSKAPGDQPHITGPATNSPSGSSSRPGPATSSSSTTPTVATPGTGDQPHTTSPATGNRSGSGGRPSHTASSTGTPRPTSHGNNPHPGNRPPSDMAGVPVAWVPFPSGFPRQVPPPTPAEQTNPMLFAQPPSLPSPSTQPLKRTAAASGPPNPTVAADTDETGATPETKPDESPVRSQDVAASVEAGQAASAFRAGSSSEVVEPPRLRTLADYAPKQPPEPEPQPQRDPEQPALPLPPAPPGQPGYAHADVARLMDLLTNSPDREQLADLTFTRTTTGGYHTGTVDALRQAWLDALATKRP